MNKILGAYRLILLAVLIVGCLLGGWSAFANGESNSEGVPIQPVQQPPAQGAGAPPASVPPGPPVEGTTAIEPPPEPIDKGTPELIHNKGVMCFEMRVGDTHEVALESNPTTGYRWELGFQYDDRYLELVDHRYESDSTLVGGGGREIFTFRALAFGSTEFSFNYKRPWEDQVLKTGRYGFVIGVPAALANEMSEAEAREIAANSECGDVGALKESAFYNAWSGTWWIDLDAQMEYCSPACVVNVATRQAEVNGRCMGVPPPKEEGIEPETPAEAPATVEGPAPTSEGPVQVEGPVEGPRPAAFTEVVGPDGQFMVLPIEPEPAAPEKSPTGVPASSGKIVVPTTPYVGGLGVR